LHHDEAVKILKHTGWLASKPPEFQEALLELSRLHKIDAGAHLTLAGDEYGDLIGLVSGTVAFTSSIGPSSTPIMHIAKPVFWMGYRPLLLGEDLNVTAQARTNVIFASFSKSKILTLLETNPNWWKHFVSLMAEYGDATAPIAADLLIQNADQRFVAVLLRFGRVRFRDPANFSSVRVPLTQSEVAAAANMSRNSAGEILRRFAGMGWIKRGYGGIDIIEAARLRDILT
jgi:CRP/FNR family cyclic AMP-dependent transcriptional regulator